MRLRAGPHQAAFSVAGARDWPPTRPGIDFLLVVLGDTLSNATAARVALRVRETVSQGRFHLSSALGKEDVQGGRKGRAALGLVGANSTGGGEAGVAEAR